MRRAGSSLWRSYTQAKAKAKREAQHRIVEMMVPGEGLAQIRLQPRDPPELLGRND